MRKQAKGWRCYAVKISSGRRGGGEGIDTDESETGEGQTVLPCYFLSSASAHSTGRIIAAHKAKPNKIFSRSIA